MTCKSSSPEPGVNYAAAFCAAVSNSAASAAAPCGSKRLRGSTTAIVLVVSTVMFILGISYSMLVRRQSSMVHQQTVREIAYSIGEATIEMASQMLKETLRNPESELFKRLAASKSDFQSQGSYGPEELVFETSQGRLTLFDQFRDILEEMAAPFGGITSGSVAATVEFNPSDFTFYEGKYEDNEHEKFGTVVVRVTVDFLGVKSSVGVRHQVRILTARPPVFHNFTLYVQKATTTSAGSGSQAQDRFNVISIDRQGDPDRSTGIPITLDNGMSHADWRDLTQGNMGTFRDYIYRKQGWIYLGGGPLVLNLSFGENDNTFSEDFHFFRKSPSSSGRTYRDYDADNKPEFSTLRSFYQVNNWDQGIYTFNNGEQNETTLLKLLPMSMRKTSLLHLYGKNENSAPCASPTLVMGQVHARFLRIAAVRAQQDKIPGMIPQGEHIFPLPFFPDNQQPTLSAIKSILTATAGSGTTADTTYQDSVDKALDEGSGALWDDWKDPSRNPILYRRVMSRPVQRSYNCSMDFIRTANTVASFSDSGNEFTLTEGDKYLFHTLTEDSHKPPDSANFRGFSTFRDFMDSECVNPTKRKKFFSGKNKDKFCRIFTQTSGISPSGSPETGDKFMNALKARGMLFDPLQGSSMEQLKLGSMIYVDGDCEIGNVQIMASGVIIARGKLTITDNIIDDSQAGRVNLLTLCSLEGNIEISQNVTDLNAYLVALSGEVINKRALGILGGVAMKKMTSASFGEWKKYGGNISFNPMLKADPSSSDFLGCMFVDVSPFPLFVQQ
ncbi:MAG: hypothetical protein CVV64_13550 [Candidatus Wallbacteria bacterium HGW-Wallbacteria-1]|jgi:hypothetical protein|uniref:Type 4 fimbrial biogenesis protein PilX N-terminal domain-containing protein n=1 Tax=Candidatus Wallbacteria bacterium HGW-Wallbacteria-1 TaxID=2013854 RepID=A0A2N1PMM4_9BACT|nr:MAG: hypothetical protein CVV64_13550 [Candidatus Wallbacteria bacterium HGW-Wallbacteria-1]